MFKKSIIVALVVLFGLNVAAQNAQESVAQVGALKVPAYTMSFEQDAKLVQNAVNQRLKDSKLKTRNVEGYTAVIDQLVPEISTTPVNLYIKVEEQGKKKNRVAVVTVCAITTDLTIDQNTMRDNVRVYLEALAPYLFKYEANQNMQAEQKNLKQAEKVAASAAAAVADLEKDIASDQKKIKDKQEEIKKLQNKIKDLEKDIRDLQVNIEKTNGKKAAAERKAEEANEGVNAKQGEVERYRQMAE